MEFTEETVKRLRGLGQGSTLKVNGQEYLVVDVQVLPEPRFELKEKKETKEEGVEIYLAEAGKEIEDPPIFSADYRLTMVDQDVEYELVLEKDGIQDLSKEFPGDHLIVHDYENERTSVYNSSYTPKKLQDIKIALMNLDDEAVELESLEF